MAFLQVEITFDQSNYDRLLGVIYQLPCDSLWEEESSLKVFFDEKLISESELQDSISKIETDLISDFHISKLEDVNWNAKWEESFTPVEIQDICFIHASFHAKKEGFKHYIEIAPKMAFGTGHHETTFMMIEAMSTIDYTDKKVLDLGCGSGILSVFAAQKEAKEIVAIDIEQPSVENSEEHKTLNNVEYSVFLGGVEDTPKGPYNIVLANINRAVLLNYQKEITTFVSDDGILLMSGVLQADASLIESAYSPHFNIEACKQKGKWLCYKMKKHTS